MRPARTLSCVAVMALPAALALSTAFAEFAPSVGGVPITTGQLGPPLPSPGQPNAVPWQQRLLWLQQQIRVLGHDPGPNQDIFVQLARQVDAVVAAAPGMTPEAGVGASVWPTLQGAAASLGTQPAATVIAPSVLQQQAPPSGSTAQLQISPPGQTSGISMGTGGSAGQVGPAPAPSQGQQAPSPPGQPPPPPAGPQAGRPPGPPAQPPPPAGDAERKISEVFRLSRELEHTVTSPMQVAILGIQAIADASKDNPEAGINVLQALLEQEQSVPLRTVIRFALKDLYAKAGQHDAALQQLQAIVRENGRLVGEAEQRMPRPGPPRQPGRPMPPSPAEPGERE